MFNLKKEDYRELRAKVRRSALINSQQISRNRDILHGRKVLVGGVVLSKKETLLTDEALNQSEVVAVWLTLYDFSGSFEVCIDLSKLEKEMRRVTCLVKVGQSLFVSGGVQPVRNCWGYYISAQTVYSVNEFDFYKEIYPERYELLRKDLAQLRCLNVSEPLNFKRKYPRSGIELILDFLKKKGRKDYFDYKSVEEGAYEIYIHKEDPRIAPLILKYYLKRMASKMIGQDERKIVESCEWKSSFFKMYPDLEDVVSWPV